MNRFFFGDVNLPTLTDFAQGLADTWGSSSLWHAAGAVKEHFTSVSPAWPRYETTQAEFLNCPAWAEEALSRKAAAFKSPQWVDNIEGRQSTLTFGCSFLSCTRLCIFQTGWEEQPARMTAGWSTTFSFVLGEGKMQNRRGCADGLEHSFGSSSLWHAAG